MFVTERIKNKIRKACLDDLRKIGITADVDKTINTETDLDYIASLGFSDYIGLTKDDFYRVVNDPKLDADKVISLVEIVNRLSIYWILCNGVRFAIDFDGVAARNFEPDQSLMKLLLKSTVEDYIFDFYGNGVKEQCRLQKQHDKVQIKGKFYTHWIFTYSKLTTNDEVGTFELLLVPDLYPKMFAINNFQSSTCANCGICRRVEDGCFQHSDGSIDDSIKIYRMSRNIQYTLESNCNYKNAEDESGDSFLHHNIKDYINVCLYAVDKYLRRKTIVRKSKEASAATTFQSINNSIKISLPKMSSSSEVTFVTIHDLVKYEKKHRTSHSHHASPREHFRRETERHLKDGRVIKVRSCVINKGKGDVKNQTVYKVK